MSISTAKPSTAATQPIGRRLFQPRSNPAGLQAPRLAPQKPASETRRGGLGFDLHHLADDDSTPHIRFPTVLGVLQGLRDPQMQKGGKRGRLGVS